MKWMILSITIIIILCIVLFLVIIKPIKMAVQSAPTDERIGVFQCVNIAVTGACWAVVHDVSENIQNYMLDPFSMIKKEPVELEGNVPDIQLKDYLFWSFENKFLVRGHVLKKTKNIGTNEYPIFIRVINVESWDIIRPVIRDAFPQYFLPKDRLVRSDFK